MTPLTVLGVTFLAAWVWLVVARDGRAAALRDWSYVPLLAAVTCLVMAGGLWLR